MARIRSIKPEFWTDEKVVHLPFAARLLFIGMWNFADDEGFLESQPDRLRLQILPNDDVDVELYVDLLCAAGLIDRIELSDDREIISIPNFARHQKISHVTKTRFPVNAGKKRIIPLETRRSVAVKYGCKPGGEKDVECYFCGAKGSIWWPTTRKGRPSSWVAFSGVELDHFIPENTGGTETNENMVLSCRYCNRSRGSGDAIGFALRKIPEATKSIPENTCSVSIPENTGALRPEGKGREGKGEEDEKKESTLAHSESSAAREASTKEREKDESLISKCRNLVGMEPCSQAEDFHELERIARENGWTEVDILAGIATALRRGTQRFSAWQSFENWIRNEVKTRLARIPRSAQPITSAPSDDPVIDLGAVRDIQSKIVNAIQKIGWAGYAGWAETEFGSVEKFRAAIASHAPHLMKFWPDEPTRAVR